MPPLMRLENVHEAPPATDQAEEPGTVPKLLVSTTSAIAAQGPGARTLRYTAGLIGLVKEHALPCIYEAVLRSGFACCRGRIGVEAQNAAARVRISFQESLIAASAAGTRYSIRRSIASTPPRMASVCASIAPANRHVSRASRLASSARSPSGVTLLAVLGGLPQGVGDRVDLLAGQAAIGEPAGDRVGVEHPIMLPRGPPGGGPGQAGLAARHHQHQRELQWFSLAISTWLDASGDGSVKSRSSRSPARHRWSARRSRSSSRWPAPCRVRIECAEPLRSRPQKRLMLQLDRRERTGAAGEETG